MCTLSICLRAMHYLGLAIISVILWMWVRCKLENEVCKEKYLRKQSEKKVNLALSTP